MAKEINMICGDCMGKIKSGEPIEVIEYFKLHNGKKTLLGRDTQHYMGYGCKKNIPCINYPQHKLKKNI